MKAFTVRTILATWVAISVLVGTTLAVLTLADLPSEQLSESVLDGGDVGAVAIVFLKWSSLTFVFGAPFTWAIAAGRAHVVARGVRREPSEREEVSAPADR